MENAVVYARYSSAGQREQSIDGQLAAAQKYASDRGYTIVKEYCDRAKTGTNDNREAFQQMLSDCAKHQFTVIIVWKVDRFGRNREEITFNKYRAKKHGVRVEYVAENITDGPESVILESVLEGMAEYYSKQLSQNVQRGLLESAKQRKAIGIHHMLGYKRGDDGKYQIDPETAPTVKLIFDKYEEGYSLFELMKYLNDRGYKTGMGKSFTKNSLPRILRNERYIGVYIYKNIIRDEDAIPAIISREQFDRVQKKLNTNRREPSHKWAYSDYILTGKLICGKCGGFMVGKSGHGRHGGKYNYYACQNHIKEKTCNAKAIRQEWIEKLVIDEVYKILQDDAMINEIADIVWKYNQTHNDAKNELEVMKKAVDRNEMSVKNIIISVEKGMDFDLVRDRLDELKEERAALDENITKLELESSVTLTRDHIVYFLLQFRDKNITDRECQKSLVNTFVNTVTIMDDEILLGMNYSSNASMVRISCAESRYDARVRTRVYRNVLVLHVPF